MAVQTKQQLVEVLSAHAPEILSFGVRRLGLFGSFLRGGTSSSSDVDLLVEFNPEEKSFDNFMGLALLLEDLLGRRVELVTREALSPYIGPRILAETEYVVAA